MADASLLDAHEALCWVERLLTERTWSEWRKTLSDWHASLGAFAMGGTPPDPPDPPED